MVKRSAAIAACLGFLCRGGSGAEADAAAQAREILAAAGVKGGLIVHIGCGDGKLTAALAGQGRPAHSFFVHGLDPDPANAEKARAHVRSLGLYGKVAVERLGRSLALPYVDNLVNLLVASGECRVPSEEVQRVLAPGGVACVREGDKWTKTVKPRPKEIDEWTHFLHDAGNNAVAADTQVGPPRSLRWMAAPLWLRSHETPSGFQAMVCGGGRVFYILDEGLIGITDQRLPERWALFCRDAFNGKLLWRRPLGAWGWPQWAAARFQDKDWTAITGARTAVPAEAQRRLVVDGERLYATLDYRAPLSILDAATGETLATVAETAPVRQIVAADGIAVVYSQEIRPDQPRPKGKAPDEPGGALSAVHGATAKPLWRKAIPPLRGLALAVDQGRVVFQTAKGLDCLDLQTGKEVWQAEPKEKAAKTLLATAGVVLVLGRGTLEAYDGANGKPMWQKNVVLGNSLGGEDMFVINGVIWLGMACADEKQTPSRKGANALAVGHDLRTGEERKRVFAEGIISPEHHHRCYRNKATSRYVISSMEGAEFLDLEGANHAQNNFVRGACMLGMVPANGLLYVPPDQCFCQPGAKLLGLAALAAERRDEGRGAGGEGAERLERGPAFSAIQNRESKIENAADWPTYRHDPARHGATPSAVPAELKPAWKASLGGRLTQPVVAEGHLFIASIDAHTVHCLGVGDGKPVWSYTAGGRIDSPPTVHGGLVLFGSADGWVYCLRASDGALAWRFLAAPADRRIACFDQLESVWPVYGSVLVREGVAYAAAGRSTYLDGGIRLYGLEPATGKVLHQTTLCGPWPDGGKTVPRDVSFYIRGANADVLVSEGDAIYMRQKRLTPSLQEQEPKVLSSKGEADVGLHVFSTAGLLDGSWYNRTFWMYAKRWPGFQLANQAPKSGQLLVVDEQNTYAVKVFHRRNVHSTMFFPGREGYLLFADKNTTEPQIVGEEGARRPIAWLPQSEFGRREGPRRLDSPAFGLDKMIGYTRAEPPLWTLWLPVRIRAMVKAGETLFAAGPPDELDSKDPYAAFEGRRGARLVAVSAKDGKKLAEQALDASPVFDGLIAAAGRLFAALEDGSLVCLAGEKQ
ncbi:MAG: methyltransferase domain-containing protein [Planctomycetes bacterium]|nr:methyltransferase domain-containing protein [Planctomycetota bacterium]